MSLKDYVKKNTANLVKFTFDTKNSEQVKLKDCANGKAHVRAMFYGKSEKGKPYATIYTDSCYFFVPDFKVAQVTEMCKDAEVRESINNGKLLVCVYEYENSFGVHKSISFEEDV